MRASEIPNGKKMNKMEHLETEFNLDKIMINLMDHEIHARYQRIIEFYFLKTIWR